MTQPNMKKEYRAELKSVRKQLSQLKSDTRVAKWQLQRELKKIGSRAYAERRSAYRDFNKLFRGHERHGARLIKRQQILEGRLS